MPESLARSCDGRGSPETLGPYYSFRSRVRGHGELTARHAQPKGFILFPSASTTQVSTDLPGSVRLIREHKC